MLPLKRVYFNGMTHIRVTLNDRTHLHYTVQCKDLKDATHETMHLEHFRREYHPVTKGHGFVIIPRNWRKLSTDDLTELSYKVYDNDLQDMICEELDNRESEYGYGDNPRDELDYYHNDPIQHQM